MINSVQSLIGYEFPYAIELFLLAPMIFVLLHCVNTRSLRLPNFWVFLLIEVLFLIMEAGWIRPRAQPVYTYPYSLFTFYALYFFLVNYGIQKQDILRIVKAALWMIFVFLGSLYLIYAGILPIEIDFAETAVSDFATERITTGDFLQQNGVSFVAVIGIYLLIFERGSQPVKGSLFVFLAKVVFMITIVIVHASRGALLIAMVGLVYFALQELTSSYRMNRPMAIVLILLLVTPILLIWINDILNSTLILQRFTDQSQNTSRLRQIYVTWVNFVNNPWFGVGYHEAARGVIAGYSRSNFHYTQILATNGIFYFGIFLVFLYKIFFSNRGVKGVVVVFGIATLMGLMFYNWSLLWPVALLAYIVYCENQSLKDPVALSPEN